MTSIEEIRKLAADEFANLEGDQTLDRGDRNLVFTKEYFNQLEAVSKRQARRSKL